MIWNIYVGNGNFFPLSSDLKPPLEDAGNETYRVNSQLWKYWLWSFQGRDTKSESFLAKN